MAKEPPTDDPVDGNPNPDPVDGGDSPPQWATELSQRLDQLPGKLRASLTDEDRDSIAERVHNLFESSGAFHPAEPPKDDSSDGEDDEDANTDKSPEKKSGFSTIAKRFQGGN